LLDAIPLGAIATLLVRGRPYRAVNLREHLQRSLIQAVYYIVPIAIAGGTPGQVAVGLRVVDVDTLQLPGLKKAAARWAIGAAPSIFMNGVFTAFNDKWKAEVSRRTESVRSEVERLQEEYPDDPKTYSEKVTALDRSVGLHRIMIRPLLVVGIVVAYQATVGRGAKDRWTRTKVVAPRS
jgi:hypothetical protein